MPFASLNEWLTHLETLHPRSIDLGLDRIKTVQQALSLDSQSFKVILVAGTNGKGSTCTFLADLLLQAGYRTGLFTSPHVLQYRERIRINKSFATDAEICEVFEEIARPLLLQTLTWPIVRLGKRVRAVSRAPRCGEQASGDEVRQVTGGRQRLHPRDLYVVFPRDSIYLRGVGQRVDLALSQA